MGYRAREVLDVYALNLLLIPVNLAGVFKSLAQAVTKRKAAFVRTPKIEGRTAAGPFFVVCEYVLVSHWLGQAGIDIFNGFWYHAVFADRLWQEGGCHGVESYLEQPAPQRSYR